MNKYSAKGRHIRYSTRGAGLSYKSFGGNIFREKEENISQNYENISCERGMLIRYSVWGAGLSYKDFGRNISEKAWNISEKKEKLSVNEGEIFVADLRDLWPGGWLVHTAFNNWFVRWGGESSNDDSEEYMSVCLSLPRELLLRQTQQWYQW